MSKKNLTLFDVIKSVMMSFLGVQKDSVRQRDFKSGKVYHFIVVAVFLTLAFILLLYGVVQIVLHYAGV